MSQQEPKEYSFSIDGAPVTKLRPRFSRHKGKVRTYNAQSDEATTVAWRLRARMAGPPLSGPLSVSIKFVFSKPKSRQKLGETYHRIKPDIDNLVKWVFDVGNKVLWEDDQQIAILSASKIYGEKPQTIITMNCL